MSLYVTRVHNFTLDRWDDTVNFVLNKPITALIYSLSMKILGFYCMGFLYPLGTDLFYILLSTSIVLDIAMFSNSRAYKRNLLQSIDNIQHQILRMVTDFYHEHISAAGRALLRGFFFRE